MTDRSASRGRQPISTGRGGAGNIRLPSVSTDARPESGPDDFSQTRGRELPVPVCNPSDGTPHIFSSGRGGAGNMRSPSRDPQKVPIEEKEVIKEYQNSQLGAPVSSGRGGLGNFSHSQTRDARVEKTVGKGTVDGGHECDNKKEEHHFIGRGGNTNKSTKHETPLETGTNSQTQAG